MNCDFEIHRGAESDESNQRGQVEFLAPRHGFCESLVMLLPPTRYVPFANGRYEVKPGLFHFGKDFGNGAADQRVFQIDETFSRYRVAKLAARTERLGKYFQTQRLDQAVSREIIAFMVRRLTSEYPSMFALEGTKFTSRLTDETVEISSEMALDALACQVQEDFAVLSVANGAHWLIAIHLCFPNHWAAEEKVGKTFAAVHAPVAGMEAMNQQGDKFARMMVDATEGIVRFVWGISTDDRLNHHPQPPSGVSVEEWSGRRFDPQQPRAFVRVERQTIWGFPQVGASLFTIRTYHLDCAEIRKNPVERTALIAAIESMSQESLRYKGLADWNDDLLRWLRG